MMRFVLKYIVFYTNNNKSYYYIIKLRVTKLNKIERPSPPSTPRIYKRQSDFVVVVVAREFLSELVKSKITVACASILSLSLSRVCVCIE